MALSQCDAFQQELAGQDLAYDVLEARRADVLTQLSGCSAARNNLGADLARLQRARRQVPAPRRVGPIMPRCANLPLKIGIKAPTLRVSLSIEGSRTRATVVHSA